MRKIYTLAAGRVLTVTADGPDAFVRQVEDETVGGVVLTSLDFGPYRLDRTFWIDNATATATALVFRMATFYLPPLWGWAAIRWLEQRSYL